MQFKLKKWCSSKQFKKSPLRIIGKVAFKAEWTNLKPSLREIFLNTFVTIT